jgi:hypothetical protein
MPQAIHIDGARKIPAEQFEREYAERCGKTVEELRATGRVVRPCECDYENCEGWQSVSQEIAAEIDDPSMPYIR